MRIPVVMLVVATTQIVGCASIVNGQNQSLSVATRSATGPVIGASCKLTNNKGEWFVTTPGSVTVHRSFQDLAVRCEKADQEPGLMSVQSSTKGMAFGNILFGGIIGAGVDIGTGAAYDYPALITVVMGQSSGAPASPAATGSAVPAAQKPTAVEAVAPAAAAASGPAN